MRNALLTTTILSCFFLAACDGKADKAADGTAPDVTIETKGEDGGSVNITSDAGGSKIAIKGDGVNISADLPAIPDISADFDIDGVKLYPGSKVTGFKILADDSKGGDGEGSVDMAFTSPATPAKLADWYVAQFKANGVAASANGTTVSGKTKDGEPFTITLTPDGAGSKGAVKLTG